MKQNPFYQVSGEVIVGSQGHDGKVTAWVTYVEDPLPATSLDFDSTGLIANEMTVDQFINMPTMTWDPCVLRVKSGEVLLIINPSKQ